MTSNPFGEFRVECYNAVKNAIVNLGFESSQVNIKFEIPPPSIDAHLAFPTFTFSRSFNISPKKIYDEILKFHFKLVDNVKLTAGYINFCVNIKRLADILFNSISKLDEQYGFIPAEKPMRIVVEHTSANPIHPLHIGAARNAVIGDTLARLLRARGHKVSTHFYIDDVGLQVSVAAYGFSKIKSFKLSMKPDHFIGLIYAITNCLLEIWKIKRDLDNAESDEMRIKLLSKLSEWVSIANELRERNEKLFDLLNEGVNSDPDPIRAVAELDLKYELGDESVKSLIREMCSMCIEGFKETLKKINVYHDSWDWESDIVWSSLVKKVLKGLRETSFVYEEAVPIFDANSAANKLGLKEKLGLNVNYEIPKLILQRSDGRSLYTTRDIAYTLWQFRNADKVIHVIGVEQSLAQLQLKVALAALGYTDLAENFIHYSYELVSLPGFKMSSRRGKYVDLDRILDEAVERAKMEVLKRNRNMDGELVDKISRMVGVGAVRYALISVSPNKKMVFTWDRILDFNRNSGPFIQYAHARACNILAKVEGAFSDYDSSMLEDELELDLVLIVSRFPEIVTEAADTLRIELITDYLYDVALKFNSFYDSVHVLKSKPIQLRNARLQLVNAVRIVLSNGLSLLGIDAPNRM
ncbi:MAG: arginine--tRNA ligase [Candidatus Methanomethylicota archaeon]|nr:MAG: arginine--tRNA ligase [Candidatus Verstraetearchaeota archaeon]